MPAYSSSEAAQMLSIAPITLRKLGTAFAAWLSPTTAGTVLVDEVSERFYNDDDLDTLRYIITLLKQKRNYAWVRERLTVEFGVNDLAHTKEEAEQEQPEQLAQHVSQAAAHIDEAHAAQPEPHAPDETPYADLAGQPASQAGARAPDETPNAAQADRFERDESQPADAPYVVEAEVVEPEPQLPPDITAMLSRMADLYQELLHNKEQEITALRQALDVTELSAANERRELEMLSRLTKMMERENQRLTVELEEARHQLGQNQARRGLLARLFGGGEEEAGSASHSQV